MTQYSTLHVTLSNSQEKKNGTEVNLKRSLTVS